MFSGSRFLRHSLALLLALALAAPLAAQTVTIGNGTAAAPTLRPIGSPTTGLFRKGPDTLGIAASGRMAAGVRDSQIIAVFGRQGQPAYSFLGRSDQGWFSSSATAVGLAINNNVPILAQTTGVNLRSGGNNALVAEATKVELYSNANLSLVVDGGASTKLTGGAGNMTIVAGTGNSRTMTLQTTTSAGTAKNTLVLGADSSATFLGKVVTPFVTLEQGGAVLIRGNKAGAFAIRPQSSNGTLILGSGTAGGLDKNTLVLGADSSATFLGKVIPGDTLRSAKPVRFTALTAASGTPNTVCIDATTKEITENAATSCVVSSARFKTDIKLLPNSEANRIVMGLKPSTFTYRDGGRKAIGLIAEQADSVDSRLASRDAQGRVNSVNYEQVTILLLSTVQQLRAEVDSLKKASGHGFGSACKKIGTTPTGMAILECPASP